MDSRTLLRLVLGALVLSAGAAATSTPADDAGTVIGIDLGTTCASHALPHYCAPPTACAD
jgi:hypothetical protein